MLTSCIEKMLRKSKAFLVGSFISLLCWLNNNNKFFFRPTARSGGTLFQFDRNRNATKYFFSVKCLNALVVLIRKQPKRHITGKIQNDKLRQFFQSCSILVDHFLTESQLVAAERDYDDNIESSGTQMTKWDDIICKILFAKILNYFLWGYKTFRSIRLSADMRYITGWRSQLGLQEWWVKIKQTLSNN